MPKRFTDSDKWKDPWFRKLKPISKMMFLYLCDQCDNAGFWEIDLERAAFDIGHSVKSLRTALEDLRSRYDTDGKYIWIRKFIEFQGNYPFKLNVQAHKGIIRLLTARLGLSEDVENMLNGHGLSKSCARVEDGLPNLPSQGQGNSKGIGQGNGLGIELLNDTDEQFDKFWQHFITMKRNVGKPSAEKAWRTTLKGRPGKDGHKPVEPSTLIEAANHYRMKCEMDGTEPKYIKHPATFLGPDRHWEDYKDVPKRSCNGKRPATASNYDDDDKAAEAFTRTMKGGI